MIGRKKTDYVVRPTNWMKNVRLMSNRNSEEHVRMYLTFHCAGVRCKTHPVGEIEGGRQTPPSKKKQCAATTMGLLKKKNAQLTFSGGKTVAEALVASQGLGQGVVLSAQAE
jgi:hypothetical protein